MAIAVIGAWWSRAGACYSIVICVIQASVCLQAADVVIMQNGDRLTGDVMARTPRSLKFKTPYAGTILIQWDQIRELTMDEPTVLLLKDESVMEFVAVKADSETLTVTPANGDKDVTVGFSEVAELAPEPWRLGDGGKFTGNVNVSAEIESGNTDSEELDMDYELTYRRKQDRFKSLGDLEIDSNNGLRTKQNWSSTSKYDRFLTDQFYYSFVAGFKQEKFADLELRTTLGPALGYQFLESREQNLLTELGALWINEDFIQDTDQRYWGPGWRMEYDRMLVADKLQFYHRQLGSQSVTSEGGLLWRSWTGLRLPVWNGFVLSAEYEIEYDGQPAVGAEKADNTFRLKIGYQW